MEIKIDGNHISNSPFTVAISPAQVDAGSCEAEGTGLVGGDVKFSLDFLITPKDRFGNVITDGIPEDFQVNINDGEFMPPVEEVTIDDAKVYNCTYTIEKSGHYSMDVTLSGSSIKDSPFSVVMAADGEVWAQQCIAYGAGLESGVAGETETFWVQARDLYGNNITDIENDPIFKLQVQADDEVIAGTVETTGTDGRYQASYVVTHAKPYNINVTLGGLVINKGIFYRTDIVAADAYGPWCSAAGDGLAKQIGKGEEQTFVITTRDVYHNLVKVGGAQFTLNLTDFIAGRTVMGSVEDMGDGTYRGSYKCDNSGHYFMFVQIDGLNIRDSPFGIVVESGGTLLDIYILCIEND
eukprot:TRINITY_DN3813_c0_g1_i1.p1 TRINITY_DN3813_c0_g1~~TRINITY_DN3813_c0_g1_i1.p1  ORF type:complete len:398 (-),score=74.82 TRINITY_DN3813_c0_g1_i1:44-1102(-)